MRTSRFQAEDHRAQLAPSGVRSASDSGFTLLAVVVMTAIVLIALSVAAPIVAHDLRRDREVEAMNRANQYVRAIQLYYRKFNHCPGSMDELEKSNNIRFLRQRYPDPMTGEANWRLIHVGENKTTVKGFFGQPLAGPAPGLGSAAGMASNPGGSSTVQASGLGAGFNGATIGSSGTTGSTGSTGATGSTGSSGSIFGSSGTGSLSGGGGPIMGIGSAKSGAAILTVNEKSTYQEWEFLYDPRIELLRAKASLLGGGSQNSGLSTFGGSTGATGSTGPTGTPSSTPNAATGNSGPTNP